MRAMISMVLSVLIAASAAAGEGMATEAAPPEFSVTAAVDADLAALRGAKRPLVIFADSADDPAFQEQMRLIEGRWPELADRDVAVIADTDPAAASAIRTKLRPRGFMMVLIDKDGTVALRKPFPWDVRELMRAIDRMPDRREEIRNRRAAEIALRQGSGPLPEASE
jgi:Domain of unknown function (DUF4174)